MPATYKTHPVTITQLTHRRVYFLLNGAEFFVPRKSGLVKW